MADFPDRSAIYLWIDYWALQPRMAEATWFRLFRVRSPLLTESLLISLPSGTEMFHFPEFASKSLCIQQLDD
jgi:hypothetical protein